MSNIKLDLNQFKHVKSDDKTTTLQHKDGHQLTLAHGALSKEAQAQLGQLAKLSADSQTPGQAGEAAEDKQKAPPVKKEPQPYQPPKKGPTQVERPDAGHGKVIERKMMAEGGEPSDGPPPEINQLLGLLHAQGGPVKMYADPKGPVRATDSAPIDPKSVDTSSAPPPALDPNSPPSTPSLNIDVSPQALREGTEKTAKELAQQEKIKYYTSAAIENKQRMAGGGGWGVGGEGAMGQAGAALGSYLAGNRGSLTDTLPDQNGDIKQVDTNAAVLGQERYEQAQEDAQKEKIAKFQTDAVQAQQGAEASKWLGAAAPAIPGVSPAAQADGSTAPTLPTPDTSIAPATMPDQGTSDMERYARNYENEARTGIKGNVAVAERQGLDEQAAAQAKMTAERDAMAHFDDVNKRLNQERLDTVQDIKSGYIDPEKYWTGHKDANGDMVGGHSKLMAAIGMIIAGFNPTNSPNAATNLLKFQIEQNLNAQKANLQSDHNLLSANLAQFKNVRDAADMTRLQIADYASSQLAQAAAKAKTAGAKNAGLMQQAELDKSMVPIAASLAARRAISTLGQAGGSPQAEAAGLQRLLATNPEVYKEMQPKFVSNLGYADNPVPQGVRDQLLSHQKFAIASKDLQSYVTEHGGTLSAMDPATRAVAAQKAVILQALFREGTLGTVYREGEQPLLDKAVKGQPLNFLDYITGSGNAKLQEMFNANQRAYDATRVSLGGSIAMRAKQEMQQREQQQAAPKTAEGQAGIWNGKPVIFKGGKWVPR